VDAQPTYRRCCAAGDLWSVLGIGARLRSWRNYCNRRTLTFTALGTGQFSQFCTDDVTWTTIQNNAQISGPQAVEEAINGLHDRMADLKTRQLGVTNGMAYVEGSCAGMSGARVPYCVGGQGYGSGRLREPGR